MKFLRLLLLFIFIQASAQQGGMWIPSMLKGMNEDEMKNLGMKITAEQIYSINKSSIKDGVPQFDKKCTAEVISDKGLIFTLIVTYLIHNNIRCTFIHLDKC